MRLRRPSASMVIAFLALVAAIGGTAGARTLITGRDIAKNAITSSKIKNHSIKTGDLARSVTSRSYTRAEADARFVAQPGTAPGASHLARLVLDPSNPATVQPLLVVPNLGTFQVSCGSAKAAAGLAFAKAADAPSVDLLGQVTLHPGGGVPTTDVAAREATTASVGLASTTGAGGVGHYALQLARATATQRYVATVTISLTYADKDVAPGKCLAVGQYVEGVE